MPRTFLGPKIRDRRQALGITQSTLATRAGISASYLNLIESNKRNIAGALLSRIAHALDLQAEDLDGAAEQRLLSDLGEIAGEPMLAELTLDPRSAAEVAGRHAGWARALVQLHRSWRDRDQAVGALSDRLSQDPFLGDAVHSMLTRVAAIRSSAEILETIEDLQPAERHRFIAIIGNESGQLADVAQALAAFFEKANSGPRPIVPVEEVDDFLLERNNFFPALEGVAAAFRAAAGVEGQCSEALLVAYLRDAHDVAVVTRASTDISEVAPPAAAHYDVEGRTLWIGDATPGTTRRHELARLATHLYSNGEAVDAEIATASLLSTEAARRRTRRVLSSYLAEAALLPYAEFRDAALAARYDIDHLCQRFASSYEQVCHRLVTLRRPGAEGVPFGLVRVDAAGYVTKRYPLARLLLPRYGNACPLWALYGAFQTPGAIVRQIAEFPTGDRFMFIARTVEKPRPSFAMPRRLLSVMLACDALHADQTVYGDGIDLASTAPAVPVGANCRLCLRRKCSYREQDPIIDA